MTNVLALASVALLAAPTCGVPPPPPHMPVYDFVISSLSIDNNDGSPCAGFNLDGYYSSATDPNGCDIADRESLLDPDQNSGSCTVSVVANNCVGGVDNVLPAIADQIDQFAHVETRKVLGANLALGHIVWLIRVINATSLENDPLVAVAIYQGWSADASCGSLFGGQGNFTVRNSSLIVPGDLTTPRWVTTGSIVSGRLRARFGNAHGVRAQDPIPVGDFAGLANVPALPVYQLQLGVTLLKDGSSGSIGNLGGWAASATMRETIADAVPDTRTIFDALIPQDADLQPNGQCHGNFGLPVGGVSMGMGFTVTHATIVGAADAPTQGVCGAQ